ncbi:MAG: cysteine desulfurase family protein [Actinomycetota bacterium]
MIHYLDNAATTRVRPGALEAMLPLFTETFGNPSGAHRMARQANHVLDDARDAMAAALGAEPGQVVFTGGGTEADALAIRGVIDAVGGTAVTTAIEHHAVLDPITHLGGRIVAVGADGRIDLDALERALDPSVSIVSIMLANNETGIIQPLDEAVAVVRRAAPEAVVHTDAVQALCWVDVAAAAADADLISVSAHKFGGPKGTGALVVRDRVRLEPLLRGGGQERDRRGGTQNVAGIAGMAAAATETVAERGEAVARVAALRDRLVAGIAAEVDGVIESGITGVPGASRTAKTANIAHLCFEGIESEALLFLLEKNDIMASAASSCASGAQEASHVLAAMGVSRDLAYGSLRLSLGYESTETDVDAVLTVLPDAVTQLRAHR